MGQTFELLSDSSYDFISVLSKEENQIFRKRMIESILATDMAKHSSQMSSLKTLIEVNSIKGGENAEKILNRDN